MKFLTREELYKLTPEESQKYYDDMLALRRFACAMVKDVSKSSVGKLESRCIGSASNFLSYESSMYVYLTNAVYRHILGESNLDYARTYKNRAYDSGKKDVTIPSVLSLEGQIHLKNYYRYIEEKLAENPRLRFKTGADVQDFLRDVRKDYAKDAHVNFAFTGRHNDCSPTSVVAKPLNSLDRLSSKGELKQTKEYPVFDEYSIKSMEIGEYLLSRARVLYANPADIKTMEKVLEEERLDIVERAGKSSKVKEFYTGSVSEVLARMKSENEKAQILASVSKKKGTGDKSIDNLSETVESSLYGGNFIVAEIKNILMDRNSVSVSLVNAPSSTSLGLIKGSQGELSKTQTGQVSMVYQAAPAREEKKVETPKKESPKVLDSKVIENERFKLRYMLETGRIDEDEFADMMDKLYDAGSTIASFEEKAKDYAGEQLTIFNTGSKNDKEEEILEDENGQTRLF